MTDSDSSLIEHIESALSALSAKARLNGQDKVILQDSCGIITEDANYLVYMSLREIPPEGYISTVMQRIVRITGKQSFVYPWGNLSFQNNELILKVKPIQIEKWDDAPPAEVFSGSNTFK